MAKKPSAIATKQTKSQILGDIAEETGLTKKQISEVMDALASQAQRHLNKKGSGEFTVPSVGVKLRRVIKPARKARKGVNPFTGEATVFKAKPASIAVKVRPLKKMKEFAAS